MALAELTEKSTTEEVSAYVEEVVKEVEAERAGEKPEEKGDARITAEHADNVHEPEGAKEIHAEKSGSEKPAKAEKSGDDKPESADWLDEDLRAEVAAFGLEESDLAGYASREEFERAMRLFNKSALAAGQKALAEADKGELGRNEKGQFVKKAEPVGQKDEAKAEVPKDGRYEIKLDRALYDEPLVDELTGIRDHYEARYQTLETRFKAMEDHYLSAVAKAEEDSFDSAIDKLDMPKLFGNTGKETSAEKQKREQVMAQAKVLQAGYKTFGKNVELAALVNYAAPMVFSSEFDKHNLKNLTRKISKQANSRQGGGATRPQDPREDPREKADRRFKELAGP